MDSRNRALHKTANASKFLDCRREKDNRGNRETTIPGLKRISSAIRATTFNSTVADEYWTPSPFLQLAGHLSHNPFFDARIIRRPVADGQFSSLRADLVHHSKE